MKPAAYDSQLAEAIVVDAFRGCRHRPGFWTVDQWNGVSYFRIASAQSLNTSDALEFLERCRWIRPQLRRFLKGHRWVMVCYMDPLPDQFWRHISLEMARQHGIG